MPAHFIDHVARGRADGPYRHGREQKDQHRSQQATHKDLGLGNIHRRQVGTIGAHFVHIRRKEQERREGSTTDGVALGQRLCGVAHRVQTIGFAAHLLGLLAHFDDTASIIGNRSKRIHGQNVGRRTQHTHRGDCSAEQASPERVLRDHYTATLAKRIGGNNRHRNHDHWERR